MTPVPIVDGYCIKWCEGCPSLSCINRGRPERGFKCADSIIKRPRQPETQPGEKKSKGKNVRAITPIVAGGQGKGKSYRRQVSGLRDSGNHGETVKVFKMEANGQLVFLRDEKADIFD